MTRAASLLCLAVALMAPATVAGGSELAAGGEATLVVEVAGIDGMRGGTLLLSLYHPDGFLDRTQEVAAAEAPVPVAGQGSAGETAVVRLTIEGLAPGAYSFTVLQDENGNRDMDQGFLGIPEEGFAFSNNVRPVLSAPDGQETALTVGPGTTVARVEMLYW